MTSNTGPVAAMMKLCSHSSTGQSSGTHGPQSCKCSIKHGYLDREATNMAANFAPLWHYSCCRPLNDTTAKAWYNHDV